jgi:hypothetical protein
MGVRQAGPRLDDADAGRFSLTCSSRATLAVHEAYTTRQDQATVPTPVFSGAAKFLSGSLPDPRDRSDAAARSARVYRTDRTPIRCPPGELNGRDGRRRRFSRLYTSSDEGSETEIASSGILGGQGVWPNV